MISEETLKAVGKQVLTEKQLDEALLHYRVLCNHLECHGDIYHLVWRDACVTLQILEDFKQGRRRDSRGNPVDRID